MASKVVASPLSVSENGLRLLLKVTPKASRSAITGIAHEADGSAILKVSVTTVPEDGKATAAVIALLAKAWRLPKSHFILLTGATDRRKTLLIEGDGAALLAYVTPLLPPES